METNTFPRMHVSLYVSNIANTVNFYNAFFGKAAVKVKPGYAKYILDSPSLIISFVENKERVQQNFGHLGFQVETLDQLNQLLGEMKRKALLVKEEMGTTCCYAKQDKFWVNDPDGVQWEVYYFHEDAEFNDPHYGSEEASACCLPLEEKQKIVLSEIPEKCCTPIAGSACCN